MRVSWSGSVGGQEDKPGGPQAQGDGQSGGARGSGYLSISVTIMHLLGSADVLWLSVTAALKQLISNEERQPCV